MLISLILSDSAVLIVTAQCFSEIHGVGDVFLCYRRHFRRQSTLFPVFRVRFRTRTLLIGKTEPLFTQRIILRDALAHEIHEAKIVLGLCVALFRRLAIPPRRFDVIFPDASARFVHDSQIVLGRGVAQLRQRSPDSERGPILSAFIGDEYASPLIFIMV